VVLFSQGWKPGGRYVDIGQRGPSKCSKPSSGVSVSGLAEVPTLQEQDHRAINRWRTSGSRTPNLNRRTERF